MSFILTKNAGVPVKYLIEGYVEQDTDRAQLRTDYTLGSKIKVIETGKTYVLTENGWKYLEESSFDPSVLDDYYTKEETDELIAALNSFVYVDTLPTENIKTNVIYLVPAEDPGDDDIKDEYLNLDGTSAGWERIGSTRIDLTQYYTKTETDAKFVEKEAGKGLSTNDYTTAEKQKLAGLNASDFATAAQGIKADNAETKNIEQDGRLDTLEDEIIVTKTISGDFLHITDAANFPAESVVTTLEPVQDLHGYDNPWPAGGGKNKLNAETSYTVAANTTWLNLSCALPAGTYIFSYEPNITSGQVTFTVRNANNDLIYSNTGINNVSHTDTFTISEDGAKVGSYSNTALTIRNPMIRLSTVTDATFEPYSNECPISGHTGVELTRTGKNLFDPNTFAQGLLSYITGKLEGANYWITSDFVGCQEIVTIQGWKDGSESNFCVRFCEYDSNRKFIKNNSNINISDITTYSRTITLDSNTRYVRASFGFDNKQTSVSAFFDTNRIQLELGGTATSYEPYQGETHSQTFPQVQSPVYGCEVDWTNGVLRVNKLIKQYTSIVSIGTEGNTKFWIVDRAMDSINTTNTNTDLYISNTFVSKHVVSPGNFYITNDGQVLVVIPYEAQQSITSVTDANAWLASNPLQVVYPLATPLEIPLTPEVITLLKGENNIWLDAGTFEKFEYYPDSTIGEQIGDLDKRVTDLENQDIETIIDVTVLPTGSAIKNAIYRLATTAESVTTYTYYLGDAENETTTEIPDKDYVDDHIPTYWEGTRTEYEALTEPLPDGTYVYLLGESVDYNELDNLPKINNIELAGNKSASDLGLATPQDIADAIAAIVDYESEVFPNG